jgi:hypothetical protein
LGNEALYTNTASGNSTAVGALAGYASTGIGNQFFGYNSGSAVTSGAKNAILGSYTGNQGSLDIRTASNYIVLSDGDGNPRYAIDNKGNLGNRTVAGGSNSLFRQVSRATGNATETFTASEMGMVDNNTALINITIFGADTFDHGGTLIYWAMPRGDNSSINTTIVTLFKGSGVTTFSISVSGNSLVVQKDSNLGVSITVIGGGGTAAI